jgi:hypothetical protein
MLSSAFSQRDLVIFGTVKRSVHVQFEVASKTAGAAGRIASLLYLHSEYSTATSGMAAARGAFIVICAF